MYAIRKVRDEFRANKAVQGEKEIENLVKFGNEQLQIIRRQAIISNLYKSGTLVIEK